VILPILKNAIENRFMTVANEMNPEQEGEEDEGKSMVENEGERQEKVSGQVLMCSVSNHSARRLVTDSMLKGPKGMHKDCTILGV